MDVDTENNEEDDEEEEDGDSDENDEDEEEDSDASGHDPAFALKPFPFNDAFLDSEDGKSLSLLLKPDASPKKLAHAPAARTTDWRPISPHTPSTPSEWPYPPHTSTWELFVLASARPFSVPRH